jgi:hypothetical protein
MVLYFWKNMWEINITLKQADTMYNNYACDVTLSVYPQRASLKNMPDHGGNLAVCLHLIKINSLALWLDESAHASLAASCEELRARTGNPPFKQIYATNKVIVLTNGGPEDLLELNWNLFCIISVCWKNEENSSDNYYVNIGVQCQAKQPLCKIFSSKNAWSITNIKYHHECFIFLTH